MYSPCPERKTGRRLLIKNLNFFVGSYNEVKNEVLKQIASKNSFIVLPCSLNDVAIASKNPTLRAYYRQIDICTTDGMPLAWWSALQTRRRVDRVYGPELTESILIETQGAGFKHVFCAPSGASLKSLMSSVLHFAPKAQIRGVVVPRIHYKETRAEKKRLKDIIGYRPSIVWIGISSPRQVVVAARWKKHFPHAAIFCVGAAFDLISGVLPTAPTWMQATGLEWLFRLMIEPRRLYKRYLFIIPKFLLQEVLTRLRGYFSL